MCKLQLLTYASPAYSSLAALTDPGKRAWCRRYGVEFSSLSDPAFLGGKGRIQMWRAALGQAEWTFFTGADVLLTNLTISPTRFIMPGRDLVIAPDGNGIQDDVFFIRNRPATRVMFDTILANWDTWGLRDDQDAISYYLTGGKARLAYTNWRDPGIMVHELRRKVDGSDVRAYIEYPRNLNAYPMECFGASPGLTWVKKHGWHRGDFAAQTAGVPYDGKVEWTKMHLKDVIQ